jgi:glc operon protein GlcG
MNTITKQHPVLTFEGAKLALTAVEREAHRNGWALCTAVVDEHGELLAFSRMDNVTLASIDASITKARTAARCKMTTTEFEQYANPSAAPALAQLGLGALVGGVPILLNGVVLGGIGASGGTGEQDVAASTAGVAALRLATS